MAQPMEPFVPVIIGHGAENDADQKEYPQGRVVSVLSKGPADGQHGRTEEAAGGGQEQKEADGNMAETQDITEGILGETGDKK